MLFRSGWWKNNNSEKVTLIFAVITLHYMHYYLSTES